MTVYNFILAFMSAGLLFFAIYYLFAVIVVYKKIFDKHFYFFMACLWASFYILFELLLALPYNDIQYLYFHKLKIISFIFFCPFMLLTLYCCFFPNGKKIIPIVFLIVSPIYTISALFDTFISLPIKLIQINTPITNFIYHIGKTNIFYKFFSLTMAILVLLSIFQFSISKLPKKRLVFLIILIFSIACVTNDMLFAQGLFPSVMTGEYCMYLIVAFIFIDFLKEDRKIHLEVVNLKNEAIRRLRITEIYTRKSLVESIEKGDDPTKFLPNNIQIATLFTDIRDFTGISEGLQPLEVVDLLNSYFNRMNSTIIKYNGEIDKLMGDCIMALFKNPDDALKSAIEMRYELAKFNEIGNVGAIHELPLRKIINNGIGLNYGKVIIGNIGSESKMDYTVVGDIVNTASRLEALTKYYKVPLIISEDLKNQLNKPSEGLQPSEGYCIRFLDEVLVKGKSHPMRIYEVFDFEPDNIKEIKINNQEKMKEAFEYYQEGDFQKALEIYESLKTSEVLQTSEVYTPDTVLPYFSERCRNLQIRKEAGLLEGWNGVFEFMDK